MTEETNNPNALVNQAGDFAKKQTMGLLSLLLQTLKKSFSYQGRATRKEFWTFTVTAFLVNILLVLIGAGLCRLAEWFEYPVITILCVLNFCLIFPGISVAVRRLHDLNQRASGFGISRPWDLLSSLWLMCLTWTIAAIL